jgi:hypothetical protein
LFFGAPLEFPLGAGLVVVVFLVVFLVVLLVVSLVALVVVLVDQGNLSKGID